MGHATIGDERMAACTAFPCIDGANSLISAGIVAVCVPWLAAAAAAALDATHWHAVEKLSRLPT